MAVRSISDIQKVWKFAHREDEFILTSMLGESFTSEDRFLEIQANGKIMVNGIMNTDMLGMDIRLNRSCSISHLGHQTVDLII